MQSSSLQPIVDGMCRNITELRGLEPAATAEEIEAAARQYVRKVSGITRPSAANVEAFETAVAEVTATTTRLLAALPPRRQPPKTVPPLRRPEVRARLRPEPRRRVTATTLTQPALKEWSAAVHALLDGRQTVLLRKGGIHEKRFDVDRVASSCCSRRSRTATPSGCGPSTATCSTPAAADSTEDAAGAAGGRESRCRR